MLRQLKAVAVTALIATAAFAIIVFGSIIGTILLFLGAVAVASVILVVIYKCLVEYQDEKRGG